MLSLCSTLVCAFNYSFERKTVHVVRAMPSTYGVDTFLPPPPGYNVHFAYPQRRGDVGIYWVTGVGNVLMAFFVGQRLYTKVAYSKGLQLDDGKRETSSMTRRFP